MSLGQLALHVAQIPAGISRLAQLDQFDISTTTFQQAEAKSTDEIVAALDQSVSAAGDYFKALTPQTAGADWKLMSGAKEISTMPRAVLLRSLLLNHWYHHR